jgi:hypothetical protein
VREQLGALAGAVKSVRQPALPMPRMSPKAAEWGRKFEAAAHVEPLRQAAAPPRVPPSGGNGDGTLTPAKQRILNALAFLHAIGVDRPDKAQVALVADTSPNGGSYNNNLSALRTAGLIEYPLPGAVALTPAGHEVADTTGVPSSSADLHASLRAKLPPAKWKLVEALIAAYPEPITKAALADRVGTSANGGSFNNNVSSLRTYGLLDYPRPGLVVATPVLFLEGR